MDLVKDTGFNFWAGKKVILRPMRESDWEARHNDTLDSNGFRLLNYEVELPGSEAMDRAFIAERIDYKGPESRIFFAIDTLKAENIGTINLGSIDNKNGTFSVGLRIYRPFRNQEYGEDAARIALRFGFLERRLQKCNSSCLSINRPSMKLHLRLGFKHEGVRTRSVYTNGKFYDITFFGLTKEDFTENENKLK